MLSGVLLHETEAAVPVQRAMNRAAGLKRPVAEMDDLLSVFLHIQNLSFSQRSLIRRLSSSLRVKGCLIQDHFPALLSFPAVRHPGVELPAVCVFIVQSFCPVHPCSLPSLCTLFSCASNTVCQKFRNPFSSSPVPKAEPSSTKYSPVFMSTEIQSSGKPFSF